MNKISLLAAGAFISFLGFAPTEVSASAWVTTSGYVWVGVHPTSFDTSVHDFVYNVSDATFMSLGTPNASFLPADPHDLHFSSPPNSYTVGGFLNNPVFLTGGTVAGQALSNWLGHSASSTGTDILLNGVVALPHGLFKFNVTHDDGAVIMIDGIGNAFNAFNQYQKDTVGGGYNPGAAGFFNFHVNYNECCTGPAILQVGEPMSVPEPSTWALMLVGFGGLGVTLRSRRKTVVVAA